MNFSATLEYLVIGKRMTLPAWPSGQFVVVHKAAPQGAPVGKDLGITLGVQEKTICKFSPYLLMHTPMGENFPWLPGHAELFAKNWRDYNEGEREVNFIG